MMVNMAMTAQCYTGLNTALEFVTEPVMVTVMEPKPATEITVT